MIVLPSLKHQYSLLPLLGNFTHLSQLGCIYCVLYIFFYVYQQSKTHMQDSIIQPSCHPSVTEISNVTEPKLALYHGRPLHSEFSQATKKQKQQKRPRYNKRPMLCHLARSLIGPCLVSICHVQEETRNQNISTSVAHGRDRYVVPPRPIKLVSLSSFAYQEHTIRSVS